jgi:protoporphyrinogen oxidase
METKTDVIIIGAGIAGLTAAKILKAAGMSIKVIEATDSVGGRVRTDEVNGFKLDRGFQVFLTAYPEARELLDYQRLDLRSFGSGANILRTDGIKTIGDPLREPHLLFKTLFSPIGSLKDKLLMLGLKLRLLKTSVSAIFKKEETSTNDLLETIGFSKEMVQAFIRPFFAGIFLENKLLTSSRMFEFVFKMFGEGVAAVPANGMQMIPDQLAETIAKEELLFNQKVTSIDEGVEGVVYTACGKIYHANQVIIATDQYGIPTTGNVQGLPPRSALTIYFSAAKQKVKRKLIALNPMEHQLVNNIAFMDSISVHYAPIGKSLIAVSVIEHKDFSDEQLIPKVLKELLYWYPDALSWQHLKTYRIPYALPNQQSVKNEIDKDALSIGANCFICGDHLLNGSINGAMKSGRLAAEAVIAHQKLVNL